MKNLIFIYSNTRSMIYITSLNLDVWGAKQLAKTMDFAKRFMTIIYRDDSALI